MELINGLFPRYDDDGKAVYGILIPPEEFYLIYGKIELTRNY